MRGRQGVGARVRLEGARRLHAQQRVEQGRKAGGPDLAGHPVRLAVGQHGAWHVGLAQPLQGGRHVGVGVERAVRLRDVVDERLLQAVDGCDHVQRLTREGGERAVLSGQAADPGVLHGAGAPLLADRLPVRADACGVAAHRRVDVEHRTKGVEEDGAGEVRRGHDGSLSGRSIARTCGRTALAWLRDRAGRRRPGRVPGPGSAVPVSPAGGAAPDPRRAACGRRWWSSPAACSSR